MLVLARKQNESILIGNDIRITIVGRSGGCVRLGVEAPDEVRILREEISTAAEIPSGEPVGPPRHLDSKRSTR